MKLKYKILPYVSVKHAFKKDSILQYTGPFNAMLRLGVGAGLGALVGSQFDSVGAGTGAMIGIGVGLLENLVEIINLINSYEF